MTTWAAGESITAARLNNFNLTDQTLEDTSDAQGDLVKHNGTKFVRFAMGTAGKVLRVNSGATDLEYASVGMELLASVTASGGATSISSGTFTAKKFLVVHAVLDIQTAAINTSLQFNADTGTNYAYSTSEDVAAVSTGTSDNEIIIFNGVAAGAHLIIDCLIDNTAAAEIKGCTFQATEHIGAATAPEIVEGGGSWGNTAAQITRVDTLVAGAGTLTANSFLRVWGYD